MLGIVLYKFYQFFYIPAEITTALNFEFLFLGNGKMLNSGNIFLKNKLIAWVHLIMYKMLRYDCYSRFVVVFISYFINNCYFKIDSKTL